MRATSLSAAVGRRLRQVRTDSGFSPERLARKAALTTSALLAIEDGRTQPSLAVLGQIAAHLGVSLSQVVRDAKQPPAPSHDVPKSGPEQIGRAIVEMPEGGDKLRRAEMAAVLFALEVSAGNKSAAARLLGIERKAMERRFARLRRRK